MINLLLVDTTTLKNEILTEIKLNFLQVTVHFYLENLVLKIPPVQHLITFHVIHQNRPRA